MTWLLLLLCLALAPGDPPQDFQLTDTRGQRVDSRDLRGRLVVLEWFNPDCPPDMAYYDPPYQQKLQQEYTARGVEWLLVCSAAHGIGGKLSRQRANQWCHNRGAHPSHILLDSDQSLATRFGAQCTPTVFLLATDGRLLYRGAVDDGDKREYLREALEDALAGRPLRTPSTRAFGCGIR